MNVSQSPAGVYSGAGLGKLADVISVDGDPLTDITCLQRVGVVFQGGQRGDTLSVQ